MKTFRLKLRFLEHNPRILKIGINFRWNVVAHKNVLLESSDLVSTSVNKFSYRSTVKQHLQFEISSPSIILYHKLIGHELLADLQDNCAKRQFLRFVGVGNAKERKKRLKYFCNVFALLCVLFIATAVDYWSNVVSISAIECFLSLTFWAENE